MFLALRVGVVAFSIFISLSALAQQESGRRTRTIALREAMQLAYKNNVGIRSANLTLEAATNSYWATDYNYYWPSLSLSSTLGETHAREEGQGSKTLSDTVTASIGGTVPILGLKYAFKPYSVTHSFEGNSGHTYSATPGIEFELPLLKGLGPMVNSIAIEQAENSLAVARINRSATLVKTMNEVRVAFWDLLLANKSLEVQRTTVRAAQDIVEETKTKIRAGILSEIELLSAEANFYTRQVELQRVEQELIRTQKKFKLLLGLSEISDEEYFVPTDDDLRQVDTSSKFELDQLMNKALEKRHDYLAAEKELQNSRLSDKKAKNDLLPELNLVATETKTGTSDQAREVAMDRAYRDTKREFYLGLKLSVSLPNVEATAASKNAIITMTNGELQLRKLKQDIQQEIVSIMDDIESSRKRIEAAQKAAVLANKKLQAEIARFHVGQVSQKNVIDFQREMVSTQISELEALVGYKKSLIQLDNALGVAQIQ